MPHRNSRAASVAETMPPRTPTFRARLMLAMTALALGVLAVTSTAVYLGVRRSLVANQDTALLSVGRAEIVAALDHPPGRPARDEDPAALDLSGLSGYEEFAQIEDASGRVLARTGNLTRDLSPGTQSLPERRARRGRATFADLPLGAGTLRCLYYPFRDRRGRPLLAIVGISQTPMQRSLRSLLLVLAASFLVGGGGAAAAASLLSRRMTDPLRRVTAAAVAISDANLHERIPRAAADRELRDLTDVLNAMLARLEGAFDAQRRFVSDASHELRSPLTNLRCMVEFALRRPRTGDDYREALASAHSEIERLTRLTGDLLALSRADAGEVTLGASCDLSGLIHQAAEAHAADARRGGIRLECRGDEPVIVRGGHDRLRQVVDNLLDNALCYAPADSTVVISACAEGEWGRLEVRDSGPGISEEHQSRIFDRFYRADPSRDRTSGGTGLGLAIVRAIIDTYQGKVAVVSRPGVGSRFIVRLPTSAPEERPKALTIKEVTV